MGSYFIFALVLTVLYIVYFAVNIIRDLYGKKGTEKTDEEVFDLGPMDSTEESVEVSRTRPGSKSEMKHTARRLYLPLRLPPKTATPGKRWNSQGSARTAESQGRGTDGKGRTYLSDGFTDEEMYKAMISKGRLDNRPSLKWRPVKDKL